LARRTIVAFSRTAYLHLETARETDPGEETVANLTSPSKTVAGTTETAGPRASGAPRRCCAYLAALLAAALLSTITGFLAGQYQGAVANWLKIHAVATRATERAAKAPVSNAQLRPTDGDLEALSRLAPQQQAERLLELAIQRPDPSLNLICRNFPSWRGHLEDSDRLFHAVLQALHSDDPRVRVAAVEIDLAANNLGESPESVEKLRRQIQSGSEDRFMALWRLGSLGNRGVEPAEALRTLKLQAHSRNQEARFWAVEGLAMLGNAAAMDALLDILAHDPAPQIRQRAANGLSKSGLLTGKQRLTAVPHLLNLLDDDALDEATQNLVRAALEAITGASFGKNSGAWRDWWAHHDSREKHSSSRSGLSLA
jgi:HEAT repeats